jgi:hypothetical protein
MLPASVSTQRDKRFPYSRVVTRRIANANGGT